MFRDIKKIKPFSLKIDPFEELNLHLDGGSPEPIYINAPYILTAGIEKWDKKIEAIDKELRQIGIHANQLQVFPANLSDDPKKAHPPIMLGDGWTLLIHFVHQAIKSILAGTGIEDEARVLQRNAKEYELLSQLKDDSDLAEKLDIDEVAIDTNLFMSKATLKWYNYNDRSILLKPLFYLYENLGVKYSTEAEDKPDIDLTHKTREKCGIIMQIYERTNFRTAPYKINNAKGEAIIDYPNGRLWADPDWDSEEKYETLKNELKNIRKRLKDKDIDIEDL